MADKELWVRIRANAAELEEALKKSASSVDAVGRRLQGIGRQLTVGVTAPLVAIAGGALKAQLAAEDAFVEMSKTVDAPVEQLHRLRDRFEELSENTIPKTANELTRIAALGGQLGITTDALEGFVETTAALDISTDLGAEDAATGLAQLANVMGTAQSDFDRLGSVIVDLGNNLATTENRILEMGQRIAGAGRQAGLSEAQVLAFAGALSSVGIEAQAGGTAFSKVLADMAKAVAQGGAAVSGFAQVARMGVSEFSTLFRQDASNAVLEFVRGLRRLSDQGANVFGILDELGFKERRVADALLRSAGAVDVLEAALRRGSSAWEDNVALAEEAEKFYNRTGASFKRFLNEVTNVAAELGDGLTPAFRQLLKVGRDFIDSVVRPLVTWFSELPSPVQQTAIAIAGLSAVMGPFLIVAGQMAQTFAAIVNTTSILAGPAGIAALTGRIARLGALLAPAGLLGAGLIFLLGTLREIRRALTEVKDTVQDTTSALVEGVGDLSSEALASIREDLSRDFREQDARVDRLGEAQERVFQEKGESRALEIARSALASARFMRDQIATRLRTVEDEIAKRMRLPELVVSGEGGSPEFRLGEDPASKFEPLPDLTTFFTEAQATDSELRKLGSGILEMLQSDLERAAKGSKAYTDALVDLDQVHQRTLTTHVEVESSTEGLRETLDAVSPALQRMRDALEALRDQMLQSFGRIFSQLVSGTRSVASAIASILKQLALNTLRSQIVKTGGSDLLSIGLGFIEALPFAEGGRFGMGTLALVGERGPELVAFDGPGRVFSHNQLEAALAGGAGNTVMAPFQANIQAIDSQSFLDRSEELRGLFYEWWLEARQHTSGWRRG